MVDATKDAPANERIGMNKAAIDCLNGTDRVTAHTFNYFWQGVDKILQEAETVPASERKQLFSDAADLQIEQLNEDTQWMKQDWTDFKNQLTDFQEMPVYSDEGDTPIE